MVAGLWRFHIGLCTVTVHNTGEPETTVQYVQYFRLFFSYSYVRNLVFAVSAYLWVMFMSNVYILIHFSFCRCKWFNK
jgi:hypothetical protein